MELIWFRKLVDAVNFAETSHDLCVFSHELSENGTRRFVVGVLPDLWNLVHEATLTNRTFYEIVQGTKNCRYYLDVEMMTHTNVDKNLENIISDIIAIHENQYGEMECVVLDSSSTVKSSYHLIWPNHIFPSNREVKTEALSTYGGLSEFLVMNKHKTPVSCIDFCVYSKWQNFRTYLSVKKGKNVPLQRHRLTSHKLAQYSEFDFFVASLIGVPRGNPVVRKVMPYVAKLSKPKIKPLDYVQATSNITQMEDILKTLDKRLSDLKLSSFDYYNDSQILVVRTIHQQFCLTAGRSHSTNNVYFIHHVLSSGIQQRCREQLCILTSVLHGWPLLSLSDLSRNCIAELTNDLTISVSCGVKILRMTFLLGDRCLVAEPFPNIQNFFRRILQ